MNKKLLYLLIIAIVLMGLLLFNSDKLLSNIFSAKKQILPTSEEIARQKEQALKPVSGTIKEISDNEIIVLIDNQEVKFTRAENSQIRKYKSPDGTIPGFEKITLTDIKLASAVSIVANKDNVIVSLLVTAEPNY